MTRRCSGIRWRCELSWAALLVAALAPPVGADQIVFVDGKPAQGVTVGKATYETVEYTYAGTSTPQKRPASDVLRIIWENERGSVTAGRRQLDAGDFAAAVKQFEAARSLSGRSGTNAAYLLGEAYLAWGRQDPGQLKNAVRAYDDFLKKHEAEKDFYVPAAYQHQAEAHVALGEYSSAERRYGELASGKFGPQWVSAGKLGQGRVLVAQQKFDEARGVFRELSQDSGQRQDFRDQATVGYARCQLGLKQHAAAAETMKKLLEREATKTPPASSQVTAQAWILWGDAERAQAGGDPEKLRWALVRYLRALPFAESQTDALGEALFKAREIYAELGQDQQAQKLEARLKKDCANSRWNKT